MDGPSYDAIIIGGGPGGCATACYLARAGKKVLVLEREVFPRFHIGESLLPYNAVILRELGLWEAMKAEGFPRKVGAQFHLGNGSLSTRFVFGLGKFTEEPEVFQVERSRFDHLLLRHARGCGADVREGWTVQRTSASQDAHEVEAIDPGGRVHRFTGAFVVDATGRSNLTGNQEGLKVSHPHLKKLAIFGHFTGVRRDPGEAGGDTVIFRLENSWFWLIPVSPEKTSVGLVMDRDEFLGVSEDAQSVFNRIIATHPAVQARVTEARLIGELRTTTDFSYYNRRLVGTRLLRVGDAAGFMDPIFSAGVFLAMWSGKQAAGVIQEALGKNSDGHRALLQYEARVRRGIRFYWRMVEQYYTTPFIELFMQPRDHLGLPAAVNAALAGLLEGSWGVRWRLQYFYFLVWLQRRFRLVPSISFGAPGPLSKGPATKVNAER